MANPTYTAAPRFRNIQDLVFSAQYNRSKFYIPLTDEMADLAHGRPLSCIAFHILGIDSVPYLTGLQKSGKAISTSLQPDFEQIVNGVLPGKGGLVAKVRGHVLMDSPFDVYSRADGDGFRWVELSRLAEAALKAGNSDVANRLTGLENAMTELRRLVANGVVRSGLLTPLLRKFQSEYLSPYATAQHHEYLDPLLDPKADGNEKWVKLGIVTGVARSKGWDVPTKLYEAYLAGLKIVMRDHLPALRDGLVNLRQSLHATFLAHDEIIMDQVDILGFLVVGVDPIEKFREAGYQQKFSTQYIPFAVETDARVVFNKFVQLPELREGKIIERNDNIWWYNHNDKQLFEVTGTHHALWAYRHPEKLHLNAKQKADLGKTTRDGTMIADVPRSSLTNNTRVFYGTGLSGTDRIGHMFITQGEPTAERFKIAQDIIYKTGMPPNAKVTISNWYVPDKRYPEVVKEKAYEGTAKEVLEAKSLRDLMPLS